MKERGTEGRSEGQRKGGRDRGKERGKEGRSEGQRKGGMEGVSRADRQEGGRGGGGVRHRGELCVGGGGGVVEGQDQREGGARVHPRPHRVPWPPDAAPRAQCVIVQHGGLLVPPSRRDTAQHQSPPLAAPRARRPLRIAARFAGPGAPGPRLRGYPAQGLPLPLPDACTGQARGVVGEGL